MSRYVRSFPDTHKLLCHAMLDTSVRHILAGMSRYVMLVCSVRQTAALSRNFTLEQVGL